MPTRNLFLVLLTVDFFSHKLVRISQNGTRSSKYHCYDIWKLLHACHSHLHKKERKKEIHCAILATECAWCLSAEK